jgi:hypothetical protein
VVTVKDADEVISNAVQDSFIKDNDTKEVKDREVICSE